MSLLLVHFASENWIDLIVIRGRTKESEAFYDDDGYLNRSESLDWAEFQARTKKSNIKRDEVASVIDVDDVDGTAVGQLQSAAAGPAPRITIRYNDPGSLESVTHNSIPSLMTRERVCVGH